MASVLRKTGLITGLFLLCLTPQAFAQNVHQVPEGGSELVYLVLTGISCAGVMFYSRKGRSH